MNLNVIRIPELRRSGVLALTLAIGASACSSNAQVEVPEGLPVQSSNTVHDPYCHDLQKISAELERNPIDKQTILDEAAQLVAETPVPRADSRDDWAAEINKAIANVADTLGGGVAGSPDNNFAIAEAELLLGRAFDKFC